ncbi:hypothetical protein CYY_003852 [Polysphondylium violaceum]|uniref:Uncharacterized protein n=1 Tax=Polysphondylium violaceum TaxID=133409 RepID=A0A8J4PW57_9MYCE|nr:hypothetical protein CYY_003852 [Polysphondylium violaceum]
MKFYRYRHKKTSNHVYKCSQSQEPLPISSLLSIDESNQEEEEEEEEEQQEQEGEDQENNSRQLVEKDDHDQQQEEEQENKTNKRRRTELVPYLSKNNRLQPKVVKTTPTRPPNPNQRQTPFQSNLISEFQENDHMDKYKKDICSVIDPLEELLKQGNIKDAIEWINQVRQSLLPNNQVDIRLINFIKKNK